MRLHLDWRKAAEFLAQEDLVRRLALGVNLVLVLLLAAVLAELTWKLVPAPPVEAPPVDPVLDMGGGAGPASGPAAAGRPAPQAAGGIAGLHLFGTKPAGRPAAQPRPAVVPETRLQLILRGVFASEDPEAAGAIIAERNGRESFYGVGDKLPGGAILQAVYPDRIVLLRGGRLETLRMPREGSGGGGGSVRRATSRTSSPASTGASLREYRDMLLNNPQQFADKVRYRPYTEGGRMRGYEIQPGRDAGFLTRFGLQPGDVVTSVNGITLNSPAKGLSILRSLAKTDRVRVEILRNGVPQTIDLEVNQ